LKKGKRGFATLDPEEHHELSSRGGKNAHKRHKWTPEEAREAGRKGGLTAAIRRRLKNLPDNCGKYPDSDEMHSSDAP